MSNTLQVRIVRRLRIFTTQLYDLDPISSSRVVAYFLACSILFSFFWKVSALKLNFDSPQDATERMISKGDERDSGLSGYRRYFFYLSSKPL